LLNPVVQDFGLVISMGAVSIGPSSNGFILTTKNTRGYL
jgi:hypothetical protein